VSQITFSFYGDTKSVGLSPHLLVRSLLAKRILLSIRKQGKRSFEIGAEIGADEDFVMDELNRLSRNALVKRANENRWIANAIILDEEEKKPLVDLAKQLAKEVASKIKDELPTLKAAFERCSFQDQGFAWNQMNYIVLVALITDLGVNHSLHKKDMVPPPPERPDEGRWYFWGFKADRTQKESLV